MSIIGAWDLIADWTIVGQQLWDNGEIYASKLRTESWTEERAHVHPPRLNWEHFVLANNRT